MLMQMSKKSQVWKLKSKKRRKLVEIDDEDAIPDEIIEW